MIVPFPAYVFCHPSLHQHLSSLLISSHLSVSPSHRASFGEASRRTWCTLVTGRRTASSTKSPATAASTVGCRSAWKSGCPRSVSIKTALPRMPSADHSCLIPEGLAWLLPPQEVLSVCWHLFHYQHCIKIHYWCPHISAFLLNDLLIYDCTGRRPHTVSICHFYEKIQSCYY